MGIPSSKETKLVASKKKAANFTARALTPSGPKVQDRLQQGQQDDHEVKNIPPPLPATKEDPAALCKQTSDSNRCLKRDWKLSEMSTSTPKN